MHRTEWRPWSAFRNATAKRATVSQDVEAFGPAVPRTPPAWKIERRGPEAELHLTGDWTAGESGVRDAAAVDAELAETGGAARLAFDTRAPGDRARPRLAVVPASRNREVAGPSVTERVALCACRRSTKQTKQ